LGDGFSRTDGVLALAVFAILLPLYCWFDQKVKGESAFAKATADKRGMGNGESASAKATADKRGMGNGESAFAKATGDKRGTGKAIALLLAGLVGLVGFSHVLVWGAVDVARTLGVSELLIGLTIIAAGTSLPELASAVVSARKGEHDFVLGNIIGSNIFNTLGVVGLAGTISPFKDASPYILTRDLPTLVLLSLSIGLFGINFKEWHKPGQIGRWKGLLWVIAFAVYLGVMIYQEWWMSAA
jgi:cation:H+ antiporter